jgi:hypothetical protein
VVEIAPDSAAGGIRSAPTVAGLEIVTEICPSSKPVSYRYPPKWPEGKPEIVLKATDSRVSVKEKDRNEAGNVSLLDGWREQHERQRYSMLLPEV